MKVHNMKHWKKVVKQLDYGSMEDLAGDIRDCLSHGSGINYNWTAHYLKNGKIQFFNSYDAMDENGMYCHIYDFRVTVFFNLDDKLILDRINFINGCKEHTCCGYGLLDYLGEVIYFDIEDYNKRLPSIYSSQKDSFESGQLSS